MNLPRWFEIEADVASAVFHFRNAAELSRRADFDPATMTGYTNAMAVMHAMQSAHTSLESALVRVLRLLGEELPDGPNWHADLLRRVAADFPGRPALLPPTLARAADRTRGFRHVAMRSYDSFDDELAEPSFRAAETLTRDLPSWISDLRQRLDPPAP